MGKITEELDNKLTQAKSLQQIKSIQADIKPSPAPINYFLELLASKGISKKELCTKRCVMDEKYGYHLLSGSRGLSREKALQLTLGAGFTLEETNTFLKYAKLAPLYSRNRWDAAIIYALNRRLSIIDTNILLDELGLQIFK